MFPFENDIRSGQQNAGKAHGKKGKLIIAIRGSGGIADEIGGKYYDDRQVVKILRENDPRTAIEKVNRILKS